VLMAMRTITLTSGIRVQRGEVVRHPSFPNLKSGLLCSVKRLVLVRILGLLHSKSKFNLIPTASRF
jgi:hypothetical protein